VSAEDDRAGHAARPVPVSPDAPQVQVAPHAEVTPDAQEPSPAPAPIGTEAPEVGAVARSATAGLPLWQRVVTSPQFLVGVVIVLFVLYGATRSPEFLTVGTWINILRNAVFILIAASFTTFVFVSGGLDLSVGSLFAVGSIGTAGLLSAGWGIVPAVLAGCAAGAAAGWLNGVLINYANIPAFITTLGMLYGARSLVVYFTGGQPISPLPDGFVKIAQAELFGVPLLILYAAAVALLAHVLLETTTFGWRVRAVGGNREAANNAGINVRRVSTVVYTLSGLSAATAGMLMAARLGSGQPSIGTGFELQVISAVIIGGTSLFGGIGSIPGSVLGSLVLSILATGLVLMRIDPVLQDFVVGLIIIVAVGLDQLRRRRMFRATGQR
jgi:ribose/xylose/arabinose/galactoside ABC-type transport system permease subunit